MKFLVGDTAVAGSQLTQAQTKEDRDDGVTDLELRLLTTTNVSGQTSRCYKTPRESGREGRKVSGKWEGNFLYPLLA